MTTLCKCGAAIWWVRLNLFTVCHHCGATLERTRKLATASTGTDRIK